MAKLASVAEIVHNLRGICKICKNMESTFSLRVPESDMMMESLESRLEQLQTSGSNSKIQYPQPITAQFIQCMMGPHKFYLTVCRSCLYRFKQNPHKSIINVYYEYSKSRRL